MTAAQACRIPHANGLNVRLVMAGLVPAIHVFVAARKAWMPGTRPGMTTWMDHAEMPFVLSFTPV